MEEFVRAVDDTLHRKKGNVVIPSFAVGRAQDILYLLTDLTRKGRLSGITLYIDSPLAAEATRITMRHPECYDDETRELFAWRDAHPDALKVVLVKDMEASRALNSLRGGAILMAGSGMCDAGRIKHLPEAQLVAEGVQRPHRRVPGGGDSGPANRRRRETGPGVRGGDRGGRGRLHDRRSLGARRQGRPSRVGGAIQVPPGTVFVAHGEESVSLEFAGTLKGKLGWGAQVPSPGQPNIV